MKTLKTALIAAAATACALTAAPALAITTVTTTDYVLTSTQGADGNSLSGTFTVAESSGAYTLQAFAATLGAYKFDANNTGILVLNANRLLLGGKAWGVSALSMADTDFNTPFFFLSSTEVVQTAGSYILQGGAAQNVTFTITPAALAITAVPEPATWAMMLVGFGMIGATARHRRRTTAIRYA